MLAQDWRGDLIRSVHSIFAAEKETLRADIHTYRVLHPGDNQTALEALEQKVTEQVCLVTGKMWSIEKNWSLFLYLLIIPGMQFLLWVGSRTWQVEKGENTTTFSIMQSSTVVIDVCCGTP